MDAGGSIILKSGIQGGKRGILRARKDIASKFLENAILGSSIGNIVNNKFPKAQLEDILPDITLPEGKVLNDREILRMIKVLS